jgi:hypothetical protein
MSPIVAFSVYNTLATVMPAYYQPFPFPDISVNEGNAWNPSTNTFVTPITGVYILSFSTGALPVVPAGFNLVVNGSVLYNADVLDFNHTGIDLTSRSVVLSLTLGQSVWITANGSVSYSDSTMLTTFKGILYSPVHNTLVAWAVHSTAFLSGISNLTMPFNIVALNLGNAWNGSTINIRVAGTYYVTVAATQRPSGGFFIVIQRNSVASSLGYLLKQAKSAPSGTVTREFAVIVNCVVGDVLYLRLDSGSTQGYTSFSGFLLYPA